MLNQLRTVATQMAQAVGSVAGARSGIEEPPHSVQKVADGVEIRRYAARIAAQTTVLADEAAARNAGFRHLAGYIFGANHQREKIAMTAPVGQQADGSRGWVIRFYMPSEWTLEALPSPDDHRVELVTVPPETVAVLRFSGDRGPRSISARTSELRDILRSNNFEPAGNPTAWFYDPPWTAPCRRRNEIAIPIGDHRATD
ncbi:SOUL family heme-binding protein [Mycolicibacterium neworleansense]|uniref:SOUL heme-binding protein n=1 Tax=Mycolicibacterium neworleansense TaxID=146018 RepID=A0A0H5RSR4_9MYCO|nr:heme-binding protein [Mycolicibacterium neworleansense]MCV7361460.1 heme-binding protein [Mycolicibacterium neworleansense]CRZ16811.1 SOUL heme-binding protein [Mycolicibacterium neworleansense]